MVDFEIVKKYHVLHYDEHPILFIGYNQMDNVVIGSFLFEDENENLIFFHSIVPNVVAENFLNRHISYLDVLQNASNIYIVTRDYNNKMLRFKEVLFENIDSDTLPLNSSFVPELDENIKSDFKNNYILFHSAKYKELIVYKDFETFDHAFQSVEILYVSELDKSPMLFKSKSTHGESSVRSVSSPRISNIGNKRHHV